MAFWRRKKHSDVQDEPKQEDSKLPYTVESYSDPEIENIAESKVQVEETSVPKPKPPKLNLEVGDPHGKYDEEDIKRSLDLGDEKLDYTVASYSDPEVEHVDEPKTKVEETRAPKPKSPKLNLEVGDPHGIHDEEDSKHKLKQEDSKLSYTVESYSDPEIDHVSEIKVEQKPEAELVTDEGGSKKGWFSRLTKGLSKSSGKIGQGISDLVTKKKLDQNMLDQLEEVLISADLGPKTAMSLVENFGKDRFGKDISEDEIKEALAGSIAEILAPVAKSFDVHKPKTGPFVVLVCGVNGVGKTTTIGKMAHKFHKEAGRSVMIAAADTFRAAAVEQLEIWAQRAGCSLFKKDVGADAAAVAYEAYEKATSTNTEILFIDTAGRMHNKNNLMAELEKIVRVLKKQNEDMPHAVLLVLDATTGQNAYEQVRVFQEMVNVSGLIVTKLDGSAKGGVVVGLADQFGLPIYAVGVGEGIGDMQPFDPAEFSRSLVGASV